MKFEKQFDLLLYFLNLNLAEVTQVDPATLSEEQYVAFEEAIKRLLRQHLTSEEIKRYIELLQEPVFVKVASIGWEIEPEIRDIAQKILEGKLVRIQ